MTHYTFENVWHDSAVWFIRAIAQKSPGHVVNVATVVQDERPTMTTSLPNRHSSYVKTGKKTNDGLRNEVATFPPSQKKNDWIFAMRRTAIPSCDLEMGRIETQRSLLSRPLPPKRRGAQEQAQRGSAYETV